MSFKEQVIIEILRVILVFGIAVIYSMFAIWRADDGHKNED